MKNLKDVNVEILINSLNKNNYFSIYQSIEIYEFLKSQKNINPLIYSVWNNEKLTGYLLAIRYKHKKGYPEFLTSRTVIWGGPLLFGDNESQNDSLNLLLDSLVNDLRYKSAIIEFRNLYDLSEFDGAFKKLGFQYTPWINCTIESTNKDILYGNIKDSKQRQIFKGLEQGVVFNEAENIAQVKEFYYIMKKHYKEKVKKPLPDMSFFESFYQWGKQSGLGVILLVKYNQKIIGGSLCPITPNKEIFEWYIGSLTNEYRHLYPGVLATWAQLDFAINNNIPKFNFMGLGSPYKSYGVRDFKLQFGGKLNNYGRYTRINNPTLFKLTMAGYRMMGFRE